MKLPIDLPDLGLKDIKPEDLYPIGEGLSIREIEEPFARGEEAEGEETMVYAKDAVCPLCGKPVQNPVAKIAKLRPLGTEKDLRTKYRYFEPLKYEVFCCNRCGYAALQTFYKPLPKPHKQMLEKAIMEPFEPMVLQTGVLTFDEAILRYKRALVCALARNGKNGEIASICLKMAWMLRSYAEFEKMEGEALDTIKAEEAKYLAAAREGLVTARQKEGNVPGMPDITVDYVIGVLSMKLGKYQDAQRLFMGVIGNGMAAASQKDKARDRIAEVKEMMKAEGL